jgi:hypothetical protein
MKTGYHIFFPSHTVVFDILRKEIFDIFKTIFNMVYTCIKTFSGQLPSIAIQKKTVFKSFN